MFSMPVGVPGGADFGRGVRPTYLFFGEGQNPDLPTSFLELTPPPLKGWSQFRSQIPRSGLSSGLRSAVPV